MKKRSIFILAGQSNMSGRGGVNHRRWDNIIPATSLPHPSILRFSAAGIWCSAGEPLFSDIDISKTCGIGPGMSFARALIPFLPPESQIGLVPCAEGGTAIAEWERDSRLYTQMVRRAKGALDGDGGEIMAVIWFQGESDTYSEEAAGVYGRKMEKLIGDLREDLGLPSLPFVQVAIASGNEELMEKVREAQLGMDLAGVSCVDAKGLPLNDDGIHLSTQAQVKLGQMLAKSFVDHFLAPTQTQQ